MLRACHILLALVLLSCQSGTSEQVMAEYTMESQHMGTEFKVTALADDAETAKKAVEAADREINRIELLISSWIKSSETAEINRNAGIKPVVVSEELFNLIERSKKISGLTEGIFDISYASIDKVWRFDGTMTEIPDEEVIQQSVALIDYENIILNREDLSVFLKDEGMKIGFGGIGKGYTANRCKKIMWDMGIENGVVNAGGDLISWGRQNNGEPWTIGIANPKMKSSAFSWLEISDLAVVTSGNYERYVTFDGKKYCHIINPNTGWPAEMLSSVTILCPDAEVADALATAVFIMGTEKGIRFVDRIKDVECLIVEEDGSLHSSKNISLNYYQKEEEE